MTKFHDTAYTIPELLETLRKREERTFLAIHFNDHHSQHVDHVSRNIKSLLEAANIDCINISHLVSFRTGHEPDSDNPGICDLINGEQGKTRARHIMEAL